MAERSILVASHSDAALERLIELAEPLARSLPQRELILTRLVEPPRGAGVRGGLQTENRSSNGPRRRSRRRAQRLAAEGVLARGVALSSSHPGTDLAHVAEREPVDLVLTEGRRRLIGESVPLGDVSVLLERAECDVAVLVARESAPVKLGPESPVLVPFGGAEHDWAALELGSWLSSATGAPLKLLGAGGQSDDGKSVTRMLADAGLLVQQTTGIAPSRWSWPGGREGIVVGRDGRRPAGDRPVRALASRGPGADPLGDREGSPRAGAVRPPRLPRRSVCAARQCHPVQLVAGWAAVGEVGGRVSGASGRALLPMSSEARKLPRYQPAAGDPWGVVAFTALPTGRRSSASAMTVAPSLRASASAIARAPCLIDRSSKAPAITLRSLLGSSSC